MPATSSSGFGNPMRTFGLFRNPSSCPSRLMAALAPFSKVAFRPAVASALLNPERLMACAQPGKPTSAKASMAEALELNCRRCMESILNMKKAILLTTGALALVVAAGAAWWSARPVPAPESTFVLLDGSSKSSASLKGQVTCELLGNELHHLCGRDAQGDRDLSEIPC